jgi:hypothetical protein
MKGTSPVLEPMTGSLGTHHEYKQQKKQQALALLL